MEKHYVTSKEAEFTIFLFVLGLYGFTWLFLKISPWKDGYLVLSLLVLFSLVPTYLLYKIYTWTKALLVRDKINCMADISTNRCISYLNEFLDVKHKLDYGKETKHVEFILDNFNLWCRNFYFNQKNYTIRQAIVNESLYFDFTLYKYLTYYDELENFCEIPLHLKTSSFEYEYEPLFNSDDDSSGTIAKATIFELTEFGVTFYKMLAAISKKCDGKKSIYLGSEYFYNYFGRREYVSDRDYIYCNCNYRAFEKLENGNFIFTKTHRGYSKYYSDSPV